MAKALILFRDGGGSDRRRQMQSFAEVLRELIAIQGVTGRGKASPIGQHGEEMASEVQAGRRVLVVEDESMIRMLLEGMLSDIGYTMTAEAGALDEAILDVNLHSEPITPVAEILTQRGLPFVFATGADLRGVPEAYRSHPTLQKPFRAEALERALQAVAPKPASA
jgi:CheY-like chemotaxis protein